MNINTILTQATFGILPFLRNIGSRHALSRKAAPVSAIRRLRLEIEQTRLSSAESTTSNRITAVNTLERFLINTMAGKEPVTIDMLTPDHIKAFERWALDNGSSPGYVALHMRVLRALFNRINGRGKELFCSVRTSNCQTEKKAVSEATIRQIKNLNTASCNERLARDVFLFCFYGMGIPLIDAVFMKKTQLKDGYITYYRHKTRRKVRVEVVEELRQILESINGTDESPYLLPILTTEDKGEAMRQYRNFYQKYSRSLGRISARLGMARRLSSYTPRHSWASIAYKNGIDINIIARALGHASTNVTMTYIREIEDSLLDSANRTVCDAIR